MDPEKEKVHIYGDEEFTLIKDKDESCTMVVTDQERVFKVTVSVETLPHGETGFRLRVIGDDSVSFSPTLEKAIQESCELILEARAVAERALNSPKREELCAEIQDLFK
jgi:hypothetical protein